MGDESWDLWEATDSLLERIVRGKTARLDGTGVLELEEREGAQEESGAPKGSGACASRFCAISQS